MSNIDLSSQGNTTIGGDAVGQDKIGGDKVTIGDIGPGAVVVIGREAAAHLQAQLDADMDRLRARRDQADQARREMRERQRVVNLRPLDMTHTFKDRVRETRELCKHLAQGGVRLVSVVGRGGMGKTALVSRVLADLERGILPVPGEDRELPVDGILYLSARSTGLSLERIYRDVGCMLGEPAASRLAARWASGDMPLVAKVEYLLEVMQDGLYLILLDNLEDELDEAGEIAEEGLRLFVERCLMQPGGARLVVTSREQVKIAPAALRGARSIPLREGLPEDEAVALLRELDPQGELGLCDASEDDLRRAVQLTGGVPRALEMLAGILHEDPTARLDDLLDDEALFGAQVVERLVAEGYQRLGDHERRVMEALAVFDRPVEETAIAYLLHPWYPVLDVRASLRRLVNGYFVNVNRATGEYSLHPLDREHAYRQPPDGEEVEVYNQRNLELRAADFYVRIRKPESEWKTIDDLAPQLAEFEHRVRAGDHDGAYEVLAPINLDYLYLWGHYAQLVEMQEKLLARLSTPSLRAYTLGNLGRACRARGQRERAIKLYEEALSVACEIGDRQWESVQLDNMGLAYRDQGHPEQAVRLCKEALAIAREVNDRWQEGICLGDLGLAHYSLRQVEEAIEFYEQALAIAREVGDRGREGIQLSNLGSAYRALSEVNRAVEFYEQALAVAYEIGHREGIAIRLSNLGSAYRTLGRFEQAIKLCEQALTIDREIGKRSGEGVCLNNLGLAHYYLGQVDRAIEFYEEALSIAREIGSPRSESGRLGNLGLAYQALGQVERAIEFYEQALVIAREVSSRFGGEPLLTEAEQSAVGHWGISGGS